MEQLIKDSEELHTTRERITQPRSTERPTENVEPDVSSHMESSKSTYSIPSARLVEKEVWLQTQESSLPIYISEAACVAFATRLCQYLTSTDSTRLRALQPNYIDESTLAAQAQMDTPWPTLIYAQLLIKTALGHINPGFHFVLKKETLNGLRDIYKKGSFNDASIKCKYFALFAIGQVYSAPHDCSGSSTVSGTSYFARALNLLQIIPERPSMTHIESLLLLV